MKLTRKARRARRSSVKIEERKTQALRKRLRKMDERARGPYMVILIKDPLTEERQRFEQMLRRNQQEYESVKARGRLLQARGGFIGKLRAAAELREHLRLQREKAKKGETQ